MHAAPTLFPHAAWRPAASPGSPDVDTPLGALTPLARVDDHPLRPEAARGHDDGAGARLWVWDGGVFRAELLRVRVSGDAGAPCEVVLWRLDAHERPAECTVECRWRTIGAATAERTARDDELAEWRWDAPDARVRIATPLRDGAAHVDGDALIAAAPLERGARFETRFLVTWSPGGAADARVPDWTTERVLATLGAPAR
jgi:hypothetical protein